MTWCTRNNTTGRMHIYAVLTHTRCTRAFPSAPVLGHRWALVPCLCHCVSFRSPSHPPVGAAIASTAYALTAVVAGLPFPRRNQCDVRRPHSPPHAALRRPVHASPLLKSGARAVSKQCAERVEACTTHEAWSRRTPGLVVVVGVPCSFTMSWKPTMDEALQVGTVRACPPPAGLYEPKAPLLAAPSFQ